MPRSVLFAAALALLAAPLSAQQPRPVRLSLAEGPPPASKRPRRVRR